MSYLTFQSIEVAGSGLHGPALEMDYMFKEEEPQRLAHGGLRGLELSLRLDMEVRHGVIEESEAVGCNV